MRSPKGILAKANSPLSPYILSVGLFAERWMQQRLLFPFRPRSQRYRYLRHFTNFTKYRRQPCQGIFLFNVYGHFYRALSQPLTAWSPDIFLPEDALLGLHCTRLQLLLVCGLCALSCSVEVEIRWLTWPLKNISFLQKALSCSHSVIRVIIHLRCKVLSCLCCGIWLNVIREYRSVHFGIHREGSQSPRSWYASSSVFEGISLLIRKASSGLTFGWGSQNLTSMRVRC